MEVSACVPCTQEHMICSSDGDGDVVVVDDGSSNTTETNKFDHAIGMLEGEANSWFAALQAACWQHHA
jgi:hypothetical protein